MLRTTSVVDASGRSLESKLQLPARLFGLFGVLQGLVITADFLLWRLSHCSLSVATEIALSMEAVETRIWRIDQKVENQESR